MREVKKVKIQNVLPKKPRRLVNIDKSLQSDEPILVDRAGKRFFRVVDGNHRYWKSLELNKKIIEVEIRHG